MAEIERPDLGDLDPEVRGLVELSSARNDGRPLTIIALLAHRPDLVEPFLRWSAALAGATELGKRRHELAALRASWHRQSDYEWGNHVGLAREAGCTDAEVAALACADLDGGVFDDGDQALLRLVDAMCGDEPVTDEVRDAASAALGPAGFVEASWTVAQYAGLSLVSDALGLGVETGLPPVPPR